MEKTKYEGNKGISIVFKEYQFTENDNINTFVESYINDLKKKNEPLTTEVDPVLSIEEDDDYFIIDNGSFSYKYLKKEIKSYSFYEIEEL